MHVTCLAALCRLIKQGTLASFGAGDRDERPA
jgi:hypothetical protein